MATKPLTAPETAKSGTASPENWRAYHIFYHGDRNAALLQLVAPLLRDLACMRLVDRFFFIRYGLGGPHLRVRWRLTDIDAENLTEQLLAERCSDFFHRLPSRRSLSGDQIRRINRSVLRADPAAGVDEVYEDNSWRRFPALFEIDRYGGLQRLITSLNLFCSSSISTLDLLTQQQNTERWKLTVMLRLAVQLSWAFAIDPNEFVSLLHYASEFSLARTQDHTEGILGQESIEQFVAHMADEMKSLATNSAMAPLVQLARILAADLADIPLLDRKSIAMSHIHMTANRLGLSNADECTLSAVLLTTANTLREQVSSRWEEWHKRRSAWFQTTINQESEAVASWEMERFAGRTFRVNFHPLQNTPAQDVKEARACRS